MTVREALTEGIRRLSAPHISGALSISGALYLSAFIDTPALDASLLLAEALGISREELVLKGDEPIAEDKLEKYHRLLEKRQNGDCIAYILGRKEFRGLEFTVNHNVLVPRPDTETLVEVTLEYIDSLSAQGNLGFSVLDLCTGSGAVGISLKNERPSLSVTVSDISAEALEIAASNAARLLPGGTEECCFAHRPRFTYNTESAVNFVKSDLFENITDRFNLIVSNPPYIPSDEFTTLAPEVRREPRLALDGGKDGLELIRKIIAQAHGKLLPGGILLLEAGDGQMPTIRKLLETAGFCNIKISKDLAGRDRVISASCFKVLAGNYEI